MPLNNNPFDNPIESIVLPRKSLDKNSQYLTKSGKNSIELEMVEADILILSPEDGSINRPDEIVISISLFNAPNVDKNTIKVYVDGKDYSNEMTIFDDVLSLVPNEEFEIGLHNVKILSKSTFGINITPVEWAFSATKGIKNISESFIYNGSFKTKNSVNTVSSISNREFQYNAKFNGELSWIKASYSIRWTNRESSFLQPLNRTNLTLKITDYFSFESGDVFPSISPYSIDGKRINGQYIDAGFKFFDFHYASGQQIRAVQFREGTDKAYAISSDKISYLNNSNRIIKLNRRGYTFPRNIITSRASISAFNLFKAGIHFYKAKDDFDAINRKYVNFKVDNSNYSWFQSQISLDTTLTGDSIEQVWPISELIDKIEQVINNAEVMADVKVTSLTLSITGEHIKCINTQAAISLNYTNGISNGSRERIITKNDILQVLNSNKKELGEAKVLQGGVLESKKGVANFRFNSTTVILIYS